jgi:hypothetical protein
MLASVADIYGDSRQGGSVGSFVHGSWTAEVDFRKVQNVDIGRD